MPPAPAGAPLPPPPEPAPRPRPGIDTKPWHHCPFALFELYGLGHKTEYDRRTLYARLGRPFPPEDPDRP